MDARTAHGVLVQRLTSSLSQRRAWFSALQAAWAFSLVVCCAVLPPANSQRPMAACGMLLALMLAVHFLQPHASRWSSLAVLVELAGLAVAAAGESAAAAAAAPLQIAAVLVAPAVALLLLRRAPRLPPSQQVQNDGASEDSVQLLDDVPAAPEPVSETGRLLPPELATSFGTRSFSFSITSTTYTPNQDDQDELD
jgi:hypothetical protein